jgi:hypothetical protein
VTVVGVLTQELDVVDEHGETFRLGVGSERAVCAETTGHDKT